LLDAGERRTYQSAAITNGAQLIYCIGKAEEIPAAVKRVFDHMKISADLQRWTVSLMVVLW
jgi:hypothetical protein